MASESTRVQRRAVAPPGRSERAEIQSEEMPVSCWTWLAAWRRALVTC